MAQMLAKLPQEGKPAAESPSNAADASPPAAPPNSAAFDDQPRIGADKLDISSWDPPFQELFDAQRPTFEPGQSIDRYTVLEELGAGAMGAVCKAYDAELDRAVAIKVLHTEVNEGDTVRFRREAQALAKLSHPNVIQVHDVGDLDGQTFIAMELVKGQTLREWMEEPDQTRPWRKCLNIYLQAGAGLAAAHEAGLIHRDFKPDNAIIDAKGQVRVLDFGMARLVAQRTADSQLEHEGDRPADLKASELALETSLTNPGTIMGTPPYMPPEQWRGEEASPHSDQFSFCVALYEALYGVRPFVGKTSYALMIAITEGQIAALEANGPVVSSRVRNVVLRGLSTDPEQRWSSMDALLAELRRLAAPPGRRYIARALAVGLAAMAGSAGFVGYLDVKDRCTGAPAQMHGIWDDARRKAVETALLGTEVSYAPGTWTRVEQRLNDYANAWTDKHTEVCEATSVRDEQSEEAMRLRMRCLSKRRTSLRASVDELADATAETVENAVKLVVGLPTLTLCDNLSRLEQQDQRMPPPEDPDMAAKVETIRELLAELAAMEKAGRYAEALEMVEPVVQQAGALDYAPLLAEAQYRRGRLRDHSGQYAEAEQDLRQAHSLAIIHNHDSIALVTANTLTFVVGSKLARHTEGQQWGEMNALLLAKRSSEPIEVAASLSNLGNVFQSKGEYKSARDYYRRALVITEKALGPEHPQVAANLGNLGNVFSSQGDYESARSYFQRALTIREKALGPDHPDVARSLSNLGLVLMSLGEYESARGYYQRALTIREKALGLDHPDVADSLNNLGNMLRSQGDYESARSYHHRALTIWEKALGPDHPKVAMSLSNMGFVLKSLGEYESARDYYQQALPVLEKALGPNHPQVAIILNLMGNVLLSKGEYESARGYYQRALVITEKAMGPEHPQVASSLNNLGNVFSSQGDYESARSYFQRALTIREKAMGPEHPQVASSLNNLGNVFSSQGDYESARGYYQRALATLEKARGPKHPDVARILNNLGDVFSDQGEYESARGYYQRALTIFEKALDPAHPHVANSLVGLAKVALDKNDSTSALANAERAVSIRETASVAPELLADVHFVFAQALWNKLPERVRARELAEQARQAYAEHGKGHQDDLAEVNTWLATHHVNRGTARGK